MRVTEASSNELLQSKLDKLTSDYKRLQVHCKEVEAENQALNIKCADHEEKIQNLQKENQLFEQDNRLLKQKAEESHQILEQLREKNKELQQESKHQSRSVFAALSEDRRVSSAKSNDATSRLKFA